MCVCMRAMMRAGNDGVTCSSTMYSLAAFNTYYSLVLRPFTHFSMLKWVKGLGARLHILYKWSERSACGVLIAWHRYEC